ncbi:SDR family NAD(P)-dependent oxidoreductase [Chloroflexota bacterium]
MEQSRLKTMETLSKFALVDRVAIVTGSGMGIGKGIALDFAKVGAHVVIAELDAKLGKATVEEVHALDRRALPIAVDVLDSEQVKGLVDKTMAEFGRIDILVNCVGGHGGTLVPLEEVSEDLWGSVIDFNLKGTFLCSKMVSRVMMAQRRGNIINLASGAATRPWPDMVAYGTAKAGVVNFTQTLAVHLAPYNIRVNCIAPGFTPTLGAGVAVSAEHVEKYGIPLGRLGRPEDMALAAIYLASDASDYVTGVTIDVRGGPFLGKVMLESAEENWQKK